MAELAVTLGPQTKTQTFTEQVHDFALKWEVANRQDDVWKPDGKVHEPA